MVQAPKPDLSVREEEAAPFVGVMHKLPSAKPALTKSPHSELEEPER